MAKRRTKKTKKVESLKHRDKRKKIPTEELRDFVAQDEQDAEDLAIPAVPIYIQEKIQPQAIIEDLHKETASGKPVLYLVAETKGAKWHTELRPSERRKIDCAAAHFGSKQLGKAGALHSVDFKVASTAADLR